MGFKRLIITDDLEMRAIKDNYDITDVILFGINAGIDIFMVCHTYEIQRFIIDLIIEKVKTKEIPFQESINHTEGSNH
jgi:beta-N-acetylhexosaminidase